MNNTSKKVAVVYAGAKSWGGIETYLELLFNGIDKTKIDLTLVSLGEWPLTSRLQATNCQLQKFSGVRVNPITVFKISKYLRKNNFDLVVSQGNVPNAYARAASLLSGVPSLVTVHSDICHDYPNPTLRGIYICIDKAMRFRTKHYIAVSKYLKEALVRSGIPADKISVVYNGILGNSKLENRNSKIDKQQLVIGSIGRLHKVKNYAELIRACSKLKIKNWKLKIIGEGSERHNLEKLIDVLDLSNRIELSGNIDNAREQLNKIDIYVQPSISEGFGLTVVEAMLAGKPVIVSPAGSLPELVDNGKAGLIMDGYSQDDIIRAINKLIENKELTRELATKGQIFARENFTIEKWVKSTVNVYRSLIK